MSSLSSPTSQTHELFVLYLLDLKAQMSDENTPGENVDNSAPGGKANNATVTSEPMKKAAAPEAVEAVMAPVDPEPAASSKTNVEANLPTVLAHTVEDLPSMKKVDLTNIAEVPTEPETTEIKTNTNQYTVQWDGSESSFGLQLKWNRLEFVVNGFGTAVAMKDALEGHSAASVLVGSVIVAINGTNTAGRSFTGVFCQVLDNNPNGKGEGGGRSGCWSRWIVATCEELNAGEITLPTVFFSRHRHCAAAERLCWQGQSDVPQANFGLQDCGQHDNGPRRCFG
jgi:hypothetical protein